jgi:translation initiation factor IF-3
MSMQPQISKSDFRTKKIKTSRHFKKTHIKKVFVELKRREQVVNLAVFVELNRKKQECLQFSIRYQETKLFGGYFSQIIYFLSRITTKKLSFLIVYRKLKAILFLSF